MNDRSVTSKEQAPTHEYSPESGWQVFCPRCNCEIKTLKTAPHSEHECILALLAKVQTWEKSCTGRHGSQQPCVSGDSSAPETGAPLTNAQCQRVKAALEEQEWTGISNDDVRMWAGFIDSARSVQETTARQVFNHERDCGLTNDVGTCECPQKASVPHERVWHIQGAPDCDKCHGAGWLYGRELDEPDEKTAADTMTKYSCDGEKCRALNGKGDEA